MLCLVCHAAASAGLCPGCRARMRPAPERVLPGGLRLVSAFEHTGPARTLVHHLKYRGLLGYADLVARVLAVRAPIAPIVAVPRVWSRFARYGVDPAGEIAARVAVLNEVPHLRLFSRPWHSPRRAGGDHSLAPAQLRLRELPPSQVVLVDDVVTSGATMTMAADVIGRDRIAMALAANAADTPSTLARQRVRPKDSQATSS
jgi:predicted amidophosphoribosyltransferase